MRILPLLQVAMAAAAGIVVAQEYAAPDSDNRTMKERINTLNDVRARFSSTSYTGHSCHVVSFWLYR